MACLERFLKPAKIMLNFACEHSFKSRAKASYTLETKTPETKKNNFKSYNYHLNELFWIKFRSSKSQNV